MSSSRRFDDRSPSWKLPAVGVVAGLVTQGGEEVGLDRVSAFVPLPAPARGASVEVLGREYGFPEKIHVPGFHQDMGCMKACSSRWKRHRCLFRETIQVVRGGGIWNIWRSLTGLGSRTTSDCTDTRLLVLCMKKFPGCTMSSRFLLNFFNLLQPQQPKQPQQPAV